MGKKMVLPVELADEEGLAVTPAFVVEVIFGIKGLWSVGGWGVVYWAWFRLAVQGFKGKQGP